LSLPVDS